MIFIHVKAKNEEDFNWITKLRPKQEDKSKHSDGETIGHEL